MPELPRKLTSALTLGAIAATLVLAGCGGAKAASKTGPTPTIQVSSSAVQSGGALPARYTCDGKNISLPLTWQGVPSTDSELTVVIVAIGEQSKLLPQWSVAHLKPKIGGLRAGKLPPGAITGINESGANKYSLCPAKGFRTTYLALVYGVPQAFALQTGFTTLDLLGTVNHAASQYGQLTFTYTRR